MSISVFTTKAEQMLKNVSNVGPRLYKFMIIQGLGCLQMYIIFTLGAEALPSYFTREAGALHAKINKTQPTAGTLTYIPCLDIMVAGALFSQKLKEPGQGPGGTRCPYFKPYDRSRALSNC